MLFWMLAILLAAICAYLAGFFSFKVSRRWCPVCGATLGCPDCGRRDARQMIIERNPGHW